MIFSFTMKLTEVAAFGIFLKENIVWSMKTNMQATEKAMPR